MNLEEESAEGSLPVGTRLEEYVILSTVGEGGFGTVYLANDTLLAREVAIKEYLPPSLAMRGNGARVTVRFADKRELFMKGMRRFINEAHILARLSHPALLSVLRFMEANGTAYMVMPFYRGHTLREMVNSGCRVGTTEDLFSILLPVLEGLSKIHAVDCYHLDISSDNIMIQENGAPVLLDFGAARHTEVSGEDPTTIILKPGFAPIEQYGFGNNELPLGPWSDIYASSAVAYQIITGEMQPISAQRAVNDRLVPLVEYASPVLPAEVLGVVDAGLALRPQERPQTVAVYVQALLSAAESAVPPPVEDDLEQEAASQPGFFPMSFGLGVPDTDQSEQGVVERGRSHASVRWSILFAVLLILAAIVFSALSNRKNDGPSGHSAPAAGARS
jgi:serine/threonine protein kinase